ncbi:MAG: thioredoxin fold domain-containing protein [Chitinophagaceae bacterium]
MKRRFLTVAFYLLTCTGVWAQDKGITFIEDKPWKDLLSMAGEKDKLIFLDCYTTWCGPCKAMSKEVFPLPQVGAFMNAHFISTKFDMEKGEGIELNNKYKKFIPGFPTYLLINSKGEVVHQVAGYNAADKFIAKINDGLEQRSWIPYSNKYEAGQRDWAFIRTYLGFLEDAYQSTTIKEVTDEMLPKLTIDAISKDSSAFRVFRKYWTNAESPVLITYLASPGIYRKNKDPERDVNEWGGRLFKRAVDVYTRASIDSPATYNAAKAKKLLDDLRKLNVSSRENMIALVLLSQAVVKNDGDNFIKTSKAAYEFGLLRYDQTFLGDAAKRLAEKTNDKARLKQYLDLLHPDMVSMLTRPDDIRNYAYIVDKMGEKTKAKEYYAIADKKQADLREKLKDFLETK